MKTSLYQGMGRSARGETAFLEPNEVKAEVASATYKRKANLGDKNWSCKSPTTPPPPLPALGGWGVILWKKLAGLLTPTKGSWLANVRESATQRAPWHTHAHRWKILSVMFLTATTLRPQAKACRVLLALAPVLFLCFLVHAGQNATHWHEIKGNQMKGRTSSCNHWFSSYSWLTIVCFYLLNRRETWAKWKEDQTHLGLGGRRKNPLYKAASLFGVALYPFAQDTLQSSPSVPKNVTLFGDRVFAETIKLKWNR